jgi:hypothetical protein
LEFEPGHLCWGLSEHRLIGATGLAVQLVLLERKLKWCNWFCWSASIQGTTGLKWCNWFWEHKEYKVLLEQLELLEQLDYLELVHKD